MFTQSRMQGLVLEEAHSAEYIKEEMLFYVVSSTVTTLTLFMLVSWLSCWIGMRMKTQARAIFQNGGTDCCVELSADADTRSDVRQLRATASG